MRTAFRKFLSLSAQVVLVTGFESSALAEQTEVTISMLPPPNTPQINGPRVLGWRPETPLLYAIPATGQAPLSYEAADLPSGLTVDSTSGIVMGTAPAAGTYPIHLTVSNAVGSAEATLSLKVGSTLALTPPMGWNSYDSFYEKVTEQDMLDAARAMKEVLQPFGWNTVVVDYLWYDPEQITDSNGRWLPSTSKFPNESGSSGFAPLAQQVHDMGLSFGIHLMRGVPRKSFNANTPISDSTYSAKDAGDSGDTCAWDDHMYGVKGDTAAGQAWYDSIYGQYADWGVDFVKVDDMMNPYALGQPVHDNEVVAVHNSLYKTSRSIILSLSPGPHQTRDVAVLAENANMWRTVNDFWDTNGLSTIDDEFDAAHAWAETGGISPGHWPDADMLPLGTIGNRPCEFSHNQQVTVMTLWSIMPSPLMFGGMPAKLDGDDWTVALLTNEEVLAVNQDALGSRGRRISQDGTTEVWARDLSAGAIAVALFNRGTQDAIISVSFSELGWDETETPTVRDLWQKQDVMGAISEISVNVPHEAAWMYTLSPPIPEVDGTGGTTAVGGANAGSGGAAAGGVGGSAADGGSESGSGGSASAIGGSGTGGDAVSPGGGADNNGAGESISSGDQGSGCSCSSAPRRMGTHLWRLVSLVGLLYVSWRRRQPGSCGGRSA